MLRRVKTKARKFLLWLNLLMISIVNVYFYKCITSAVLRGEGKMASDSVSIQSENWKLSKIS